MKKLGILAMAAAMMGMASATQEANKQAEDFNDASSKNRRNYFPDRGMSPKHFGLYVATRQSHIVKRKRRSKVAFG